MKISICTQIKNRLYQFSKTFNENIETIKKYSDIEWIIVDYGSSDGLNKYIEEYVNQYDFIKYYRTIDKDTEYSIPIAKNLAARLSSGDFILNLDCDNFLDNIIEKIKETNTNIGVFCNEYLKGTYGRIGVHRDIYIKVGGYDEYFFPAAVHDNDLILRCQSIGYEFLDVPSKKPSISNLKEDTIININNNQKITWEEMKEYNIIIMNYNAKKRVINSNNNIFTPCSLVLNFKDTIQKTHEF